MNPTSPNRDGGVALRDHVREKALEARSRYGTLDFATFQRMLADETVVRHETRIVFDEGPLEPGEFAHARMRGERPSEGFDLYVHPSFREREDVLPQLLAYHLVRVNYGEIVTHEEAELYGATLLGMDVEAYYERLCALADSLPGSSTRGCGP